MTWMKRMVETALQNWRLVALFQVATMGGMFAIHHVLLDDAPLPDVLLPGQGYSPSRLLAMLDAFGSKGRLNYLLLQAYDLFPYMWMYTASLIMALYALSKRFPGWLPHWLAYVLPCITLAADVLENTGQIYTCYHFSPTLYRNDAVALYLALVSSVANFVKWISFGVNLSLTLGMPLLAGALSSDTKND